MAGQNETIGGIAVQIVGNYAPLLADIQAATAAAQKGGSDIAAGLNRGAAAAGEFEQKIQALVSSGATLAEALAKVQTGASQMTSAVGAAGAAAQTAATQLRLFDEAAMVPYADAAGQLNMFADELEPIANDAKQAASGVEQFAQAEQHAGTEAVQASSRIDALKQTASELSQKLQDGARGLMVVGAALTAAVTVPLVGVAMAAIKVSGELEQARVAFTTMLGSADAARDHLEKLKAFALATPFEFPDLVIASKRLQALGFTAKEIIPTLTAVGNAASALGSGAEGINRITLALGQMQMATKVTAQDMRQLTEAGIPAWQILAKTLNTDVAGAMELVHKRAVESATAVPALLAGMNAKFHGMMEAQAKTLLGLWSNFKDAITFALMDIGDSLAPIAKTVLTDGLMPLLEWAKAAAHAFAALPPVLQTAVVGLGALAAAVGPLLVGLGGMGFAITQISAAIPILTAIAGGLASVVGVALVAALAAAVIGFNDLNERMGATHAKFDETDKKFQTYIAKLIDGAKTADQMAAAEEKVKLALEAGALSKTQATEILGKLAEAQKRVVGLDWSKQAQEMGLAFHVIATGAHEAMTTSEAFAVRMKAIRDEVGATRETLNATTIKYQEHKASAADVGRAYDAWQAATQNLKNAQNEFLPVVTNVHKATREFVEATKEYPSAAQSAANAADALMIKVGAEGQAIADAARNLNNVLALYRTGLATSADVSKALDTLTQKQAIANKEIDASKVTFQEYVDHLFAAAGGWKRMEDAAMHALPALAKPNAAFRDTQSILSDMGVKMDDVHNLFANKLLKDYDELAGKQHTLAEDDAAWEKISGTLTKIARTDLPFVLKMYDERYAQQLKGNAAEGELLATTQKRLDLQIRIAEQTGTDATKQIIGLQNVKLAQGLLYDQTHLLGDLYVDVTNDALKGFDLLGKSVADAIFDSKNLGDAFIETGKKIGKTILEDIIGTYFKALKDEILKSTGLLDGMARSMGKIFGGKAADAAGSLDPGSVEGQDAAKLAGAVKKGGGAVASGSKLGTIDTATAIGQLISSIVGNFQMAKMETSLNAIEHNTRFLEIVFQKFAEQDEWQRHGELLEALGNIFTRLGEVGVGMIQTVAATSAEVVNSIRNAVRPVGEGASRVPPAPPYTFTGPDAIANGILNGLIRGGGPPLSGGFGMADGGPVVGDGIRYLHDGEFVVPRAQVPQMQGMSSPASARSASVSIAAGTNTFHIYEAANPRETARQVAEMLKILSPRFAAFAQ